MGGGVRRRRRWRRRRRRRRRRVSVERRGRATPVATDRVAPIGRCPLRPPPCPLTPLAGGCARTCRRRRRIVVVIVVVVVVVVERL